jgi:hypothetical protein
LDDDNNDTAKVDVVDGCTDVVVDVSVVLVINDANQTPLAPLIVAVPSIWPPVVDML